MLRRLLEPLPRTCSFVFAFAHSYEWALTNGRVLRSFIPMFLPALFVLIGTREQVYNILWALVFGFATINILSLGARRFEQHKTGLNFGEILAILVVLVSIILLAWEMLYLFGVLPIRLSPG